jgi:hypothetical protein
MNPLSLIMIGFGIILVYVGWKGSQHVVMQELTGHAGPKGGSSNNGNTQAGNTQGTGTTAGTAQTGTAVNASTQR